MQKILMLKGLPASGKSTYAKKLLADQPGTWKRVNKDDMRAMLDNSSWSKGNERFVLKMRDIIVMEALMEGWNVIIDDTNFDPKHRVAMLEIMKKLNTYNGRDIEVDEKFFDTSLEDCILHDSLRGKKRVGKKVIMGMYRRYLKSQSPIPQNIPGAPDAIICDIDGTLAIMKDRGPFEWDKVDQDDVNEKIRQILYTFRTSNHEIIIFSGRDSICREKTLDWLNCKGIPFDGLYMRPAGDVRKDSIVKKEMFDEHIKGKYNIAFVLDDRNQVVDMWRNELGLTCLQVAEGDF